MIGLSHPWGEPDDSGPSNPFSNTEFGDAALPDPLLECSRRMMGNIARSLDRLLAEGIAQHIGEAWCLSDVAGRLQAISYAHHPYTDYAVDDQPFLRVWPGKLYWEGNKATWRQNYLKLA